MFSLEICHLLNYSFCFYSAIGPTFVLELSASYTVFCTLYPGEPRGPGGEILYPRIPGGERCERGWLPYPWILTADMCFYLRYIHMVDVWPS